MFHFILSFFNFQADKHTKQYEPRRGSKNGLFRTQIGLNVTVSRALFHYGKIHVRCVGVIEDQIWKGSTDRDGSSHNILTILLPEQLKWERPPAEFTGKEIILGYSYNKDIMEFLGYAWIIDSL